jgi:hypothetical protein
MLSDTPDTVGQLVLKDIDTELTVTLTKAVTE